MLYIKAKYFLFLFFYYNNINESFSHGMMYKPASRSSLWRFSDRYPNATKNYNDNEIYCGGLVTQWNIFKGKCGVCGDVYNQIQPRANENTGRYGKGIIAEKYKSGSIIETFTQITANHKGFLTFSLCELKNPKSYEPDDCFKPLLFADNSTRFYLPFSGAGNVTNQLRLPKGVRCERCVLRWQYTAGNNWGKDENGRECTGCGPEQETFRNCADITIS